MPQPLTLADYIAQGQNSPDPGAAMRLAPFMQGQQGMDTSQSVDGGQTLPPNNPRVVKAGWTGMATGDKKKGAPKLLGTPAAQPPQLLPVNDNRRQELLNAMNPTQIGGIQAEKEGLSAQQAEYERQRGRTPDTDFSPLMALSDTWFGGNMARGYQPPLRQEDLDKLTNDLQGKLQSGRHALSEDEINLLKSQLGAEEKHQDTALRLNEMTQQGEAHNKAMLNARQIASIQAWGMKNAGMENKNSQADINRTLGAAKGFNSDPTVVESTKASKNADIAQNILDMALTNPTARQAAKLELARMVVPQRLNETEIGAFGGSTAATQKLDQIFTDLENGQLTPENHKYMTQFVASMKRSAEGDIQNRLDHHATQFSKISGMPVDDAKSLIGGTYAAPQAPTGGGGFPRTVKNAQGHSATVTTNQEAAEAAQEGFK